MKTKWVTYNPPSPTHEENWKTYMREVWGDNVVFGYGFDYEDHFVVKAYIQIPEDDDGTDATPETSD